jgi:hypothetical protein
MEEGCQKSKRLSHMAKFKQVVQCAEEKGNHIATAIFGVDETMFDCDGDIRHQSMSVRHHEINLEDQRKDNFLKFMMQS